MNGWLKKVLVGTDGSEDAALATRAAIDLSNKTGAELHIVHVWRKPQAPSLAAPGLAYPSLEGASYSDTLEKEAGKLLEEQARLVQDAGGSLAQAHLREGRASEEISGLAEELGVDLVMVGSRGLGAVKRLVTGSVSEGVVRLAPCPALVMRGGEEAWPPARVVIGDDSSEEARKAGELAASIGGLFGAPVLLVGAFLPEYEHISMVTNRHRARDEMRRVEELLKARASELEDLLGERPQVWAVARYPAAVIQEMSEEDGKPTLVALGSRGLGAVRRFALGSVSTAVLRSVDGPVLIVPSPKAGAR